MRPARQLVGTLTRFSSLLILAAYLFDRSLTLFLARQAIHITSSRLRPAPHLFTLVLAFLLAIWVHSGTPNDVSIVLDFIGRAEPLRWKLLVTDFLALLCDLARLSTMLAFHTVYYTPQEVAGLDLLGAEAQRASARSPPEQRTGDAQERAEGELPPPEPRTVFPPFSPNEISDNELIGLVPTLVIDVELLWRIVNSMVDKNAFRWQVAGNSRSVPI